MLTCLVRAQNAAILAVQARTAISIKVVELTCADWSAFTEDGDSKPQRCQTEFLWLCPTISGSKREYATVASR